MSLTPVRYRSTRSLDGEAVSFRDALLNGLAPDGGLYLPDRIPRLDMDGVSVDFREFAFQVLWEWLKGDVNAGTLEQVVHDAFDFPVPIVPITPGASALSDGADTIHVMELYHGPTLSFKDFGARFLGRVLGALAKEPVTILVATSGDTGSAVADGCSGIPGVHVVLLYPDGQVSPIQERQLITRRKGVTAVRVRGSFDDCQRLVKGAFTHAGLAGIRLTTANSINIGRLLPQMLYYVHAALSFERSEAPLFVVPSGNLGNLTAGVLAHLSGMPAAGFLAAHNRNDFFPRWMADHGTGFSASFRTLSNAMDVGAPSNFERLEKLFRTTNIRSTVQAVGISDARTKEIMRDVWKETEYLVDPHTAVGLAAVMDAPWRSRYTCGERRVPAVVLSTAHPAKFQDIVKAATGETPAVPDRLVRFLDAQTRVTGMDVDGDALADIIRSTS